MSLQMDSVLHPFYIHSTPLPLPSSIHLSRFFVAPCISFSIISLTPTRLPESKRKRKHTDTHTHTHAHTHTHTHTHTYTHIHTFFNSSLFCTLRISALTKSPLQGV